MSNHPGADVPELAQVFDRAWQEIGLPKGAVDPRTTPDMAEVVPEWTAQPDTGEASAARAGVDLEAYGAALQEMLTQARDKGAAPRE